MTRDAKTKLTTAGGAEETGTNALHQHERVVTPSSLSESRIDASAGSGVKRDGDGDSATLTRGEVLLGEEAGATVDSACIAVVKQSLLTPLVAEQLALSTPALPLVSTDEQQVESAALHSGDSKDEGEVVEVEAEPGEPEEAVQANRHKKRNRRALFEAGDGDAGGSSNPPFDLDGAERSCESIEQQVQCGESSHDQQQVESTSGPGSEAVPGAIMSSRKHQEQQHQKENNESVNDRLLEKEAKAIANSVDHKRASPHEIYDLHTAQTGPSATTTATRNAFDDDPDDEPTLLIRKKWKRSLHETETGVLLPLSTLADAHQQSREAEGYFSLSRPSRLSFTRSMSSHSVFISKPSPSTPNSISNKPSAIASSSSSAQAIDGGIHQLVLPTIRSASHPDLNVISPQTVSRLLDGDFKAQLASYALIDCRFAYEHEGGSLKGAQSLCDPTSVEQKFLWNPSKDCKRTALVFYCEFSANRAPKMLRHVRNLDRWIHAEKYPELFYPELYLVDGGYKNCFETIKHLSCPAQEKICEPQSYTPMNHHDFVESCKREFALWRKRWKAHKTSGCAAKFQLHHHHQRQGTSSGSFISGSSSESTPGTTDQQETQGENQEEEDFGLDLPALHPLVTLRSFSEML